MSHLIVFLCMGVSGVLGLFIFLKPELTIELQKRFYEKINWRMEPISMPKEIRNTRVMGMFLVVMSLLGLLGHMYMPFLVKVGYELKCCVKGVGH